MNDESNALCTSWLVRLCGRWRCCLGCGAHVGGERDGSCCIAFLCGGVNSPLLSPSPPAGRQVSLRLAEEAKKRERFEELKQHLEQEQEVKCGSNFKKRVEKIEVYIN